MAFVVPTGRITLSTSSFLHPLMDPVERTMVPSRQLPDISSILQNLDYQTKDENKGQAS